MESLPCHLILYVLNNFLSNLDKINFIRCQKGWYQCFHNKIIFHESVSDKKIDGINYPKGNFKALHVSTISSIKLFPNLEEIIFDDKFNESIVGLLPKSVKKVVLGKRFNQYLDGAFPDGIEYLSFGSDYSKPIKNIIPGSTKHLEFHQDLRIDVNEIPLSITSLKFYGKVHNFNNIIINNLVMLVLPSNFDERIDNLPISLEYIEFGYCFNQSVDNMLPIKLKYLIFGGCYNKPFHVPLPDSLIYVKFGNDFDQRITIKFPHRIKKIVFGSCYNQPIDKNILPENLETLKFGGNFNSFNQDIENCLPDSLKVLHLGNRFRKPISKKIYIDNNTFTTKRILPDSLITLTLGSMFEDLILDSIPPNVTKLNIYHFQDHIRVPPLLTHLEIHKLTKPLASVEEVNINGQKCYRIKKILPDSVRELKLHHITYPIYLEYLPTSLEILHVNDKFSDLVMFDGNNFNVFLF